MIDIKYVKDNKIELKKTIKNKNIDLDLDRLIELWDKKADFQRKLEKGNSERNILSRKVKDSTENERKSLITKGVELKKNIAEINDKIKSLSAEFELLEIKVPTIPASDTPVGKSDAENQVINVWGEKPVFGFVPKTHIQIGEDLDIIDFVRGSKIGGYRGYYLKNEGVSLVMGIMMYAISKMLQKGYSPMIPPTLVKEFVLFGSGYFKSTTYDPGVDEIYQVATPDKNSLNEIDKEKRFLIGTAEPALLAYYSGEVLDESQLPMRLCGYSQCYRSEIGSYGKDTKGMYRVHEFMKVEQVILCKADIVEADKLQLEMVEISKEMHEELGLPYRQLRICTGDMSPGKYKMFDIEAWMPGLDRYGETGSASNFVDWQSRRLNVRYQDQKKNKKYVYMLNNTALPSPRVFISILENYQQKDGSIKIPKALWPFMPKGLKVIKKKND